MRGPPACAGAATTNAAAASASARKEMAWLFVRGIGGSSDRVSGAALYAGRGRRVKLSRWRGGAGAGGRARRRGGGGAGEGGARGRGGGPGRGGCGGAAGRPAP